MTILQTIFSFFLSLIFTFSGIFPFLPTNKVNMDKFELVWSDEFDGDSVDETKWRGVYFSGDQTVVRKGGYWNLSQVDVKDGNLYISTDYYENGLNGNGKAGWYSGAIFTRDLFSSKHGYYEVRCILPEGSGMWSAFWLNCEGMQNVDGSGKDGAEIDVFESAYYDTVLKNFVQSAVHYDGYGDGLKSTTVCKPLITDNNPYKEYNTYGLEWNEKEYIFYINGRETGRSSFGGTSDAAEYLILSVEVGGANGTAADSWAGSALQKDAQPTDFIVDYVRVYQYK